MNPEATEFIRLALPVAPAEANVYLLLPPLNVTEFCRKTICFIRKVSLS